MLRVMSQRLRLLLPACLVLGGTTLAQDAPAAPPRELGAAHFVRDLDAVLARAGETPVFALFQEVPG